MSSPGPGQILFTFVRHWSRRSTSDPSATATATASAGDGDGGGADVRKGAVGSGAAVGGGACIESGAGVGGGEAGVRNGVGVGTGAAGVGVGGVGVGGVGVGGVGVGGVGVGGVGVGGVGVGGDQGRLVLVTEAVNSLARRGAAATVNAVAHEIGIDQSGASRLIKGATEGGYLAIQTSASDARRRQATVTAAGHALLEQAHAWQEAVFDRLTEGWSERRREDFASAMTELIERSHALDT